MKNWLILTMFKSKKFLYAVTGIVTPFLMTHFGWGADVAETVWQTFLVLILGQGIADTKK